MTIEKELQQLLEQKEPIGEERPFRLESLDMVKTGKGPRIIGALLLIMFFVLSALVLFVPWRQSVVGSGEIIVFAPMQRPQQIEALIPGRLLGWYVRDGELVKAGQLIADLTDLDPRYLDRNQLKRLV